jgi:hypothetical protein
MDRRTCCILVLLSSGIIHAQAPDARPWQQITVPTVGEVAAHFKSPPREYGAIQPFASWNGSDPAEVRARISRDFDRLSSNGIFIVNLSPGRRSPGEGKYLSPEHMEQVKFTVQEAAKRNMRLWIQDESDYPSGFAGGYISERYAKLGMQDIVADIQVHVAPGQTLTMPVPTDTLAIMALESDVSQTVQKVIPISMPADSQLKWTVPSEGSTPNEPRMSWQVVFVRHVYLSSPTRNFNRADGTRAKDATYSIIDYLDPKATDAFLSTVHETYRGAVGDQFGKIVLGFFGDEPDYSSGIPWTPTLLDQFKAAKGYDLAPYIPFWFSHTSTQQSERASADYYDVWSSIFRSSYFGEQAAWAKKYNVEYLVHLNHEETMLSLEHSEGDYFRDNRYVQVPGIDNLGQLVPGAVHLPDGIWNINNNFPKLASSAAHLFGHPQVWAEEGGGVGVDGKYQMDYQLVRGVNALEIRTPILRGGGAPEPANAPPPAIPPQASLIAWYANRGGYLMAVGRPAAQVGLYHPGNSIWLGGTDAQEADRSTTKLGWELLQHQIDWDYFDEQSLSSVSAIEEGGFKNLSGQVYKAIVFPSMTVITRTGLERLRAYVKAGGRAIFVGKTPRLIMDKTFLDAKEIPDLSFATLVESSGEITSRVIDGLPAPDLTLSAEFPRAAAPDPSFAAGDMLAELDGDWTLDLNGKQFTTPLKSWEELGTPSFAGTATYRKHFTAPSVPARKHVYLEISDAHDYARVLLNGMELGAQAWQPYRWDISAGMKPGLNDLEIQVNAPPSSRPPGAPPAPAAASATAANAARRPRPGAPAAPAVTLAGTPRPPETPLVTGLQGPIRLVAH